MAANITIVGRLTSDPELKHVGDDKTVCELRVAYNQQRGNSTGYIDVQVWGKPAATHAEHLGKGHQVQVSGELRFRQNTTDDRTYTNYSIVNPDIEYLGRPRNGNTAESDQTPADEAEEL